VDQSIASPILLRQANSPKGSTVNADPTIAAVDERPAQQRAARPSEHDPLHRLIAERYAAGFCPAQIFAALTSGSLDTEAPGALDSEAAVAALQRALGSALAPREATALRRGCPGPDIEGAPSSIQVLGREVKLLMNIGKPRIMLFGDLLDDDECDEVMHIARPRLTRSTHNYDGGKVSESLDDARTSYGADLLRDERIAVCDRLDARIEALLNWPVDFSAKWQVLRYGVGGEFRPHYDCFHDSLGPWHPVMRAGGHRCGSLLVYLKTPARGGTTIFPELSLDVPAHRGSALYFGYTKPTRVLHGGAPVLEGEKWVMVKWFRQGPFDRA
jgi:prolyl 4-hydroxylase